MAVEELLAALETQADSEIGQIRAHAQAEADEVRAQAQAEADAAADAYVAEVVGKRRTAAEQELHKESSSSRRRVADVRREVFEEVFVRAGKKIGEIRSGKDYPDILRRLVADATADLDGGYVLHVDPQDKSLMSDLFPGVTCVTDISAVGGVVVTSADGRIQRSSTFEDRLQRVHEKYGETISEVLAS